MPLFVAMLLFPLLLYSCHVNYNLPNNHWALWTEIEPFNSQIFSDGDFPPSRTTDNTITEIPSKTDALLKISANPTAEFSALPTPLSNTAAASALPLSPQAAPKVSPRKRRSNL